MIRRRNLYESQAALGRDTVPGGINYELCSLGTLGGASSIYPTGYIFCIRPDAQDVDIIRSVKPAEISDEWAIVREGHDIWLIDADTDSPELLLRREDS